MATDWTELKPNWEVWRHIPNPKVSELVTLSLDFESNPDYVERRLMGDYEFHAEWKRRSHIAIHNIGVALHPVISVTDAQSEDPRVNFVEFAKWALSLEWNVPAKFAERATKAGQEARAEKPLADPERKTLLKIVLGVAIKCFNYDPHAARQPAAKDMQIALQTVGIEVTDDTIRKYLKEASGLASRDSEES